MEKTSYSKLEVIIILFSALCPIAVCVLKNYDLSYGFIASIILTYLILLRKKISLKKTNKIILKRIIECKLLYVLIFFIGANVSMWLASGVVPTIIYYGLKYMQNMNYIFIAFLIIAVSSIFMGTAVGTLSTIGVALLGVGQGLGISSPVLLGAIVSGAFIADKISPISGLLNLTLTSTDTTYKNTVRTMTRTLIPTIIITGIIYYIMGNSYTFDLNNIGEINAITDEIRKTFIISPYLLFIPLIIVFLSIAGVKSVYSIAIGTIITGGIAFILQGYSINEVVRFIIMGYKGNTTSTLLNSILVSGGVVSMVSVVIVVIGAIILSGLLEEMGIVEYITEDFIKNIRYKGQLITKTTIVSSILTIVTCDQTLGIVLTARLLKDKYSELGVKGEIMARTISDSSTIIAPIIPWNINAIIITSVTGILCTQYGPYAILCFIFPVIMLLTNRISS